MKRQKRQKLFMSILAGFLALLMLLPKAWTESYNEASAGIDSGTLTGVLAVAVAGPVIGSGLGVAFPPGRRLTGKTSSGITMRWYIWT